jgi:uncharacterized membrane protein YfcA
MEAVLVGFAVLAVAFLYSSVGHAGASGYLAIMLLAGYAPEVIRPLALLLNVVVACLSSWQFWRAGHFQWALFWPFALLSVPCAFLGGYLNLPVHLFKILVGVILLYSAFRFVVRPRPEETPHTPPRTVAIPVGGALGLLSGLTGTGGGIFLTPLMIFMRWARTRTASATSALFILVNSVAGLSGNFAGTQNLPPVAALFVGSVLLGGSLGSYFGSRRFSVETIKRLLATVLTIAGLKLLLT